MNRGGGGGGGGGEGGGGLNQTGTTQIELSRCLKKH